MLLFLINALTNIMLVKLHVGNVIIKITVHHCKIYEHKKFYININYVQNNIK